MPQCKLQIPWLMSYISCRQVVSLWTCSKVCAISFAVGVFVGFTLKRRCKRWVTKLLKRLKDDWNLCSKLNFVVCCHYHYGRHVNPCNLFFLIMLTPTNPTEAFPQDQICPTFQMSICLWAGGIPVTVVSCFFSGIVLGWVLRFLCHVIMSSFCS